MQFTGTGTDLPLLEWLQKYTFPTEAKFNDDAFATDVFTKAVRRHLINGTTTAVYFSSTHASASIILADICEKFGQRAFIGKVIVVFFRKLAMFDRRKEKSCVRKN